MSDKDDELLMRLDRESQRKTEAVRQLLLEKGRPDLLQDFDRRMRDIRLGVDGARNCWHSLSPAQRTVLQRMGEHGNHVWRDPNRPTRFHHRLTAGILGAVVSYRAATIAKLVRHDLLAWDPDEGDGHDKAMLTERGKFVLAHGRQGSGP